jgi:hypothetical protein
MSLIKLRLNRLSVSDKIQFGRQIVRPMTAARAAGKARTTVQDDAAKELDWEIRQLASTRQLQRRKAFP